MSGQAPKPQPTLSPEARRRLVRALARLVLEEERRADELRRLRELR